MTDYTGIAAAGAVANGGKQKNSESSVLATARTGSTWRLSGYRAV
jgi:hypothetical protein